VGWAQKKGEPRISLFREKRGERDSPNIFPKASRRSPWCAEEGRKKKRIERSARELGKKIRGEKKEFLQYFRLVVGEKAPLLSLMKRKEKEHVARCFSLTMSEGRSRSSGEEKKEKKKTNFLFFSARGIREKNEELRCRRLE